jgi:hypothetical protein
LDAVIAVHLVLVIGRAGHRRVAESDRTQRFVVRRNQRCAAAVGGQRQLQ